MQTGADQLRSAGVWLLALKDDRIYLHMESRHPQEQLSFNHRVRHMAARGLLVLGGFGGLVACSTNGGGEGRSMEDPSVAKELHIDGASAAKIDRGHVALPEVEREQVSPEATESTTQTEMFDDSAENGEVQEPEGDTVAMVRRQPGRPDTTASPDSTAATTRTPATSREHTLGVVSTSTTTPQATTTIPPASTSSTVAPSTSVPPTSVQPESTLPPTTEGTEAPTTATTTTAEEVAVVTGDTSTTTEAPQLTPITPVDQFLGSTTSALRRSRTN